MIAAIRPDDWNLPLLVHVTGAMLLFATVLVAAASTAAVRARGGEAAALMRTTFRVLLLGSLPAYLLMRVGAQWIESVEGVGGDAAWIGIGYAVADGGLLLAVIATVLAWRLQRRDGPGSGAGLGFLLGLTVFLVVAYAIAIWAMTAKPG